MKFFTREWYRSIQIENRIDCYDRIPDKAYSTAEIRALYKERMEKDLEELRELTDDEPFDEEEERKRFSERYRHNIRSVKTFCPEWMRNAVDRRLLGLMLLPGAAYERYEAECHALREANEAMYREYERVRLAQNVPEGITSALDLHDASLLSLRKAGRGLVMTVNKGWSDGDGSSVYRRVNFKNAEILERDKGLLPRKTIGRDGQFFSWTDFLYCEVYRREERFEVHIMFFNDWKLPYLTVTCGGVDHEDLAALN